MSYYRDRNGAEVDLVVEGPERAALVETKASATPSAALLAGARRVRGHLAGPHASPETLCVYGGDAPQRRSDGLIVPWRQLHHPQTLDQLIL